MKKKRNANLICFCWNCQLTWSKIKSYGKLFIKTTITFYGKEGMTEFVVWFFSITFSFYFFFFQFSLLFLCVF